MVIKKYMQEERTQGKLPNAIRIMVLGIVGINVAAFFGAGIVLYFVTQKYINLDMPIFLKAPSNYRKSYKLLKIGEKLAKAGLWIGIGFIFFWVIYIVFIVTMISGGF